MSAYNHTYQDSSFNIKEANRYTLLLQLATASFSYTIVHQNSLLVFAENCPLSDLSDPDQLINLLSPDYKKVIIGLPSTGLTLVPASLFSTESVAGFARLLDVKDNETVFAQTLNDENMIVYKADEALIAAIDKFDLNNTVYSAKGLVNAIAITNPPDTNLYIDLSNGTAQFLYFSLGKLRFYNAFEFSNADELVYFTGLVAKEVNLNPAHTTLVLSGSVNYNDVNASRLGEFFATVELNNIHVLELPDQIAPHALLALAGLSLCV